MKTIWLSVFLMTSCVTAWFPHQEAVFWGTAGKGAFVLQGLTISTRPTTGDLQKTALDLAVTAARSSGLILEESAERSLTVSLDEREFSADLDTLCSVSVVIKVWVRGLQIGQVLYSEDTKRTLRSASYLRQVLAAAFARLAQELRNQK